MRMRKNAGSAPAALPTPEEVAAELRRERHKRRYAGTLRGTIYILITVAAAAVLVATLWMPVLRIYGTSMTPTLTEGDIVISLKSPNIERGDIIGFYYNNKLLVKRVIGMPGDVIDIDYYGAVSINGEPLEEDYLGNKALGECDIELPYTVPDERWFVMGDNRENSLDSRSTTIGCISKDQIVGRLVFTVWPTDKFGKPGAASGVVRTQQ